ncbi:MAG: hypothetical protein GXX99_04710 [Clostridiales bacterium]|nr:hypothetical protein [Clostridiales bacterium]
MNPLPLPEVQEARTSAEHPARTAPAPQAAAAPPAETPGPEQLAQALKSL